MKRGRKNQADTEADGKPNLTVIQGDFGLRRPDPPSTLTQEQAKIWRLIVDDEPLECFTTQATRDMLKDLCIARSRLDETGRIMSELPADQALRNVSGSKHFLRLQKMWDYDMRAAATLATKLRLTNQSRYTPPAAATASRNTSKGLKVWDWEK